MYDAADIKSPNENMLQKMIKKALLVIELTSYSRVLRECDHVLTDEIRNNIQESINEVKAKLSSS